MGIDEGLNLAMVRCVLVEILQGARRSGGQRVAVFGPARMHK
jgi:hypothetical protein